MDNNHLTGSITTSFGALKTLNSLDLDNNKLTGSIPEEIFDLTSLMSLDLDSNRLTGTISTKIGLLKDLFIAQFDLNQLVGAIPSETGSLQNLGTSHVIRISFRHSTRTCNPHTPCIPVSIGYFTATGNKFSSPVPAELCGVPSEALIANCAICVVDGCCTECAKPVTP